MNIKLDPWNVMVGAIAAMVAALLVFALEEVGVAIVVIVTAIVLVAMPDQHSPEPIRARGHRETVVVHYKTSFSDSEYGVMNRWWRMEDGSIEMEMLPCDQEGNLENSEPVYISNSQVEGWWYK